MRGLYEENGAGFMAAQQMMTSMLARPAANGGNNEKRLPKQPFQIKPSSDD
jgi:hypothetical protein